MHAGIGYDIIHEHPNCEGAAVGAASYRDFLMFAHQVEKLEGGVAGQALAVRSWRRKFILRRWRWRAMSLIRGTRRSGTSLRPSSTPMANTRGFPARELPRSDPGYYFRPHKTMLVRTVKDGGESFYFEGPHRLHRCRHRVGRSAEASRR